MHKSYSRRFKSSYLTVPATKLLDCLYIIRESKRFMKTNDVNDDHMLKTIKKWSELANINNVSATEPTKKLGKLLQMNITLDEEILYSNHNPRYTDVNLLSKPDTDLYRPVISMNVIRGCNSLAADLVKNGGAAQEGKHSPVVPQKNSTLFALRKNKNLTTVRTAMMKKKFKEWEGTLDEKPENEKDSEENSEEDSEENSEEDSEENSEEELKDVQDSCVEIKLDFHMRMIIDDKVYKSLVSKAKDGSTFIVFDETYVKDLKIINEMIQNGYCWKDDNKKTICQPLNIFYSELETQELYNLVYAIHTLRPINSGVGISIENKRSTQTGGGRNDFGKNGSGNFVFTADSNVDTRRHIFFLLIKISDTGQTKKGVSPVIEDYRRVVIKMVGVAENKKAYQAEARNYEKLAERHAILQNNFKQNKTDKKSGQEEEFYNKCFNTYYNQGTTDKYGSFVFNDGRPTHNLHNLRFTKYTKFSLFRQLILYPQKYYFITEHDDSYETLDVAFNRILEQENIQQEQQETLMKTQFMKVIETHEKAMDYYGFYHGDLKPDNILINNNNEIKIFDLDYSGFCFSKNDPSQESDLNEFCENSGPILNYGQPYFSSISKMCNNLARGTKKTIYQGKDIFPGDEQLSLYLHAHDIWRLFYTTKLTIAKKNVQGLFQSSREYNKKSDLIDQLKYIYDREQFENIPGDHLPLKLIVESLSVKSPDE